MLQKFLDSPNVLGNVRGGWTAGSRIIFPCLQSFKKTLMSFKYTCKWLRCITVPWLY